MRKDKIVTYCRAFYDEERERLKVEINGGIDTAAHYMITDHILPANKLLEVRERVAKYWKYVDKNVKEGVVDLGSNRARTIMFDRLKTQGGRIAQLLLPRDAMMELWKHAAMSDILCLSTNLQWVPWEALYNPEAELGNFFSWDCVIARVPTKTSFDSFGQQAESVGRIVCLDPLLDKHYEKEESTTVSAIFRNIGEDVYITDVIENFTETVSTKKVISWICEHDENKGLRLCEDVHFSYDDCYVHRFPSGSVVFIMSCGGGRTVFGEESYASKIVANSDCTVIAPSSMIAARAGVDFATRLADLIKREACSAVFELWALLKRPFGGELEDDGDVTPEKCYALWFCIFGNCEADLRTEL